MLFYGKHEYCQTQAGGCECFDPHSLRWINPRCEDGAFVMSETAPHNMKALDVLGLQRSWSERKYQSSGSDTAGELRDTEENEADRPDNARQEQRCGDIGVEQATSDTEEEPRRHEQADAETEGDVHRAVYARTACSADGTLLSHGGLHTAKGEHEERCRSEEFEECGCEVIS